MKPLSLYLHIPFCMKKCAYCDFLSGPHDLSLHAPYVEALISEIKMAGAQLRDRTVASVFVGGGTPSCLQLPLMEAIFEAVYASFTVHPEAEITIECNPGTISAAAFKAYRAMGINRLSLGLQSANDDELALLGRIHTYSKFLHTFELARRSGFYNINVDIMTGLPYQTSDKLLRTLEQVTSLRPEHISAYALIIEDGTPFHDAYFEDVARRKHGKPTAILPDEDAEYTLYKLTQHYLAKRGYGQYEISNYARDGFDCYHNQVYWTRGEYRGLGLGAASLIDETRFSNTRDIREYISADAGPVGGAATLGARAASAENALADFPFVDPNTIQSLPRSQQMEEYMYLGLRRNVGITRAGFFDAFGVEIDSVYGQVLQNLQAQDLLTYTAGHIALTEKGMDLSNYVLAEFLMG